MNKILLVFSLLFSLNAFSQIDHSQWETEKFKSYIKNSLVDLMLQTRNKANLCAETAMNTNVSTETISTINKLNLSKDEATIALGFLAYKAQEVCVGDLPLKTIGYLQLARKLGISNYDQTSDPDFKNLNALVYDREQEIRFKYLLSTIPKEKMAVLEKIDELKSPFNISVLSKIDTVK